MSDLKEKKIRIMQLAVETGLSTDTLIEFLKKKGHKVTSASSPVTDDMARDVADHFKKDIEKTKAHNKKVQDIKKTAPVVKEEAKPKKGTEKETKSTVSATTFEPEPEQIQAEQITETQDEPEVVEMVEEIAPMPEVEEVEVIEVESEAPAEVSAPEPVVETPVLEPVIEAPPPPIEVVTPEPVAEIAQPAEPVVEPPKEVKKEAQYLSPVEKTKRDQKGLTILGKIDLDANKRAKRTDKPQPEKKGVRDNNRRRDGKRDDRFVPKDRADQNKKDSSKDSSRTLFPGTEEIVGTGKTASSTEPQKTTDGFTSSTDAKPKRKVLKKNPKLAPTDEDLTKKRQKIKKVGAEEKEIEQNVRKTLSQMEDSSLGFRSSVKKRKKKERLEAEIKREELIRAEGNVIKITEFATVNDLANLMGVSVSEVIAKCMALGLMVSINQRLELDNIILVADDFGFKVEQEDHFTSFEGESEDESDGELTERSPIVTIMGHVDHGKTSLLDFIRKANVVAGEAGGITQHIGAYKVEVGTGRYITFLDTPGHEAFTAMRARGAQVTDIVVLVVAADDAVMPQTVEAINHAQAAGVRIIVAINKIDKPGVNPEKIKQQLADRNILVEEWGGNHQCVELSAKSGKNVDVLLEKILLEAELLQLKAGSERTARGVIIESKMDKGRGMTATVLIQKGTLSVGDPFTAGIQFGRVRAMFDERDNRVDIAGPATPVLVTGFEGPPQAGDLFVGMRSEREAREIATRRQQLQREQDNRMVRHVTLDEISQQIKVGGVRELPIIVKGDVDGSVQALSDSLMKLSTDQVKVSVLHRGVGAITEGDVLLAEASNAIIIGFHVRPNSNARRLAENGNVDIRLYNVIYNAISEVKSALEGLLAPILSEEVTGTVEVRDTFKVPRVGTVAGCYVLEGKITRNSKLRLIRDGVVIYEGELSSLKRFKEDVREVDAGYECGLGISNFNDIKVSDIIEVYKVVETKQKLS